jgi:GNAT superfamily N-acetyltransferase
LISRYLTEERADVPVILQLIQELADYEKASDEVKATKETLLNTLAFAPTPDVSIANTTPSGGDVPSPSRPARTLLIFTPEGKPAGMALYFYNYSTWRSKPGVYLEDLFVRESERNHGYGQRLLGALAKEVVEMNGGRLEWSVLKWNKPSIDFYERIGATAMTEWMTMRVDGDGLKELAKRAL